MCYVKEARERTHRQRQHQKVLRAHEHLANMGTVHSSQKSKKYKATKTCKANLNFLNQVVYKWFLGVRTQNVPISGTLIQGKFLQYSQVLGIFDFHASDGWIRR